MVKNLIRTFFQGLLHSTSKAYTFLTESGHTVVTCSAVESVDTVCSQTAAYAGRY